MADKISLALENRTLIGKKVNRLRHEGILPATVYGKGVGPFAVQVNARVFSDTLRHAGRTTLVELQIPGQKPQSAFIHALQRHPVTRAIIHADFRVVDLRTEITVAGQKTDRNGIKTGMTCSVDAPSSGAEAKAIACN